MDFNASLRRAIRTGEVVLGQNETRECVENGTSELIVIAKNCPAEFTEYVTQKNGVSYYVYEGSGMQLGKACGRPHLVSALAIVKPGDSDILTLKS
jgi:large subunit ribosomal protein L30e